MRRVIILLAVFLTALAAMAQTDALNGYCNLGGTSAQVSGLPSTNKLQGIIPGCTVTVYLTGTTTKATIFADGAGTPLGNPFTANAVTSPNAGAWIFWANDGVGYDVVGSGGTPPNNYPAPITLCTDCKISLTGGAGTLTDFASGNLSPLFTTTVTNPTTTPVQSFAQISQTGLSAFGNWTGTTGPPFFATFVCAGSLNCAYSVPANTFTMTVASAQTIVKVNGAATTPVSPINFSNTTPAPPTGFQNVSWQQDGVADISANVPVAASQLAPYYAPPAPGQYVFLTPTSCGVAPTGSNGAGSGSCSPDGGAASISGSGISGLNQVNMKATWGFTLPSYVSQANISAVYLAYSVGFTYAGIGEDVTAGTCTDGSSSVPFASSGNQIILWGSNVVHFVSVPVVNSLTCTVGATGSGYIVPGTPGFLTFGAAVGLFVYYTGAAPPASSVTVKVVPPLAYQSGLLYFPFPFDVGNDVASTNAYNVTIPALNNILGGQQLTPGIGVTLVVANGSTSTTPTLNVNGTGALTIQKSGNALVSGDIAAGEPARLYFDGVNWQLENPVHQASGVTTVSNSDSSLTISPTTGAVVASVNVAHTNPWSASQTFNGGFDASGAAQVKLPVTAGYASATNGEVGYDSTNNNWHLWKNGADFLMVPIPTTFTSGHCAQPTSSGGSWSIADAGGACGLSGGGVTSFSGDGALLTNSSSTGGVTATLGNAGGHKWWGNNTGSSTTPGYESLTGADMPAVPTVVDTSTPVTVSTTNSSEFHFNENGTAATAITYDLPTAAAGKQFCFANAYNGSAPNTGTLELLTSAAGQFIIFTDGTLSATGGFVISGGAAADAACVAGVDSTHWMLYVQSGTWAKH